MILEDETFEAFEYYPSKFPQKSNKLIVASCELCGKFRVIRKDRYRTFCKSCSHLLGEKIKGKCHYNFGKHSWNFGKATPEETKALQSEVRKGKYTGRKNPNWNGGKKAAQGREYAKRKQLGYTLLLPLKEGEAGHHVTNEYVIGIPKDIHATLSGGSSRKKHRVRILEWLKVNDKKKYNLVLSILEKK